MENNTKTISIEERFTIEYIELEGVEELPESICGIPMDEYTHAVMLSMQKSDSINGKTLVNYSPGGYNVVLRGESLVKKADLMSKDFLKIIEKSEGFTLKVVAKGPSAIDVSMYDIVDIINTKMMSRVRFIPHALSISEWLLSIEADKDLTLQHQIAANDPNQRVSGMSVERAADAMTEIDKNGFVQLAYDKPVKIVEYFIVESHNINGSYVPLQRVHPSK